MSLKLTKILSKIPDAAFKNLEHSKIANLQILNSYFTKQEQRDLKPYIQKQDQIYLKILKRSFSSEVQSTSKILRLVQDTVDEVGLDKDVIAYYWENLPKAICEQNESEFYDWPEQFYGGFYICPKFGVTQKNSNSNLNIDADADRTQKNMIEYLGLDKPKTEKLSLKTYHLKTLLDEYNHIYRKEHAYRVIALREDTTVEQLLACKDARYIDSWNPEEIYQFRRSNRKFNFGSGPHPYKYLSI